MAETQAEQFIAVDDFDKRNLERTARLCEIASSHVPQDAPAEAIELEELDLAPFVHVDQYSDQDRERVCAQMVKACEEIGFLVITNHGVSLELIEKTHALAQKFFREYPLEKKQSELVASEGRVGWGETKEKENEFLIMKPHRTDEADVKKPEHAGNNQDYQIENKYLPAIPGFEETVNKYYNAMASLECVLLNMLAQGLAIEPELVHNNIGRHKGLLYFNYSRKRSDEHEIKKQPGGHTDWGPLTILLQGLPALHVLKDEKWHNVRTGRDKFVVNLGDAMNRWTNGRFASTIHCVRQWLDRDRVSIPYFVAQSLDPTDNRPIKPLVASKDGSVVKEYSYNDFIQEKADAFYAYTNDKEK